MPVSPERQFTKVLVSFARAPVLPERKFCQSASFARVPAVSVPVETKGIRCFSFKPYHILNLTKRTALFQRIKTEITLTQKKMLKYILRFTIKLKLQFYILDYTCFCVQFGLFATFVSLSCI